jgi:hypothetical protein
MDRQIQSGLLYDDPRLNIAAADREARNQAVREIHQLAEKASKAYDRLKEAEKILGWWKVSS